jgi:hypothetical protein
MRDHLRIAAIAGITCLIGCGSSDLDLVGLTPTTLSDGLVAHWTFDQTEGPDLLDDSGNRRNGVISGATFRSDGRFGNALHFRDGDSVTVDNFPYATASWSFSAWVRIGAGDATTNDFGTIVSTEILQQGGWQFQTKNPSMGMFWTFAYWNQDFTHHECVCFEPDRWSHATVVRDAALDRISFYIDGKIADAEDSPPPILQGTSTLFMGKWMGAGRLFSGSIDDVAIYRRALSAAEVAEIHTRPPPPPQP